MNCKEARKFLDAYGDGELAPSLMLDVDNHIEACESCGALSVLNTRLKTELGRLGDVKAPEHLRGKIEAMRGEKPKVTRLIIAAAVPLAAAASLLIVLTSPFSSGPEEQLSKVVADVVARHAGALPMEVTGPDPVEAASWFRGKVDFPVKAPSLNLQKASFQGARLSNVRAHQAAHMTYSVDGHRVTLMIFARQSTHFSGGRVVKVDDKDVLLGEQNGFNVAVLLDGDMAYALSSDLPQERLLSLVDNIVKQ
jgi:anti-sigma factor RsiW